MSILNYIRNVAYDKKLHLLAGSMIVSYTHVLAFGLSVAIPFPLLVLTSVCLCWVIAKGKEDLYDASGRGTQDPDDIVWTMHGGIPTAILLAVVHALRMTFGL